MSKPSSRNISASPRKKNRLDLSKSLSRRHGFRDKMGKKNLLVSSHVVSVFVIVCFFSFTQMGSLRMYPTIDTVTTPLSNFEAEFKILAPPGVVVLGMHRSGTSMLGGILSVGAGFEVPGEHLNVNAENSKGFFETKACCRANDAFLKSQDMAWNDIEKGPYRPYAVLESMPYRKRKGKPKLKDKDKNVQKCQSNFRPNAETSWMMKDPRLCLTMRSWMYFFTEAAAGIGNVAKPFESVIDKRPAVIFTFRHPLEVAKSLSARKNGNISTLTAGFKLWIEYNVRSIEHSKDLCRVVTSNELLLGDAMNEMTRILTELRDECNVVIPNPEGMTNEVIQDFIDSSLNREKAPADTSNLNVLAVYGGNCIVNDYNQIQDKSMEDEKKWYLRAMKLFCDMKSGEAFASSYQWPSKDVVGNIIVPDTFQVSASGKDENGAVGDFFLVSDVKEFESITSCNGQLDANWENPKGANAACTFRAWNQRSGRIGNINMWRLGTNRYQGKWSDNPIKGDWCYGDLVKLIDYEGQTHVPLLASYETNTNINGNEVQFGRKGLVSKDNNEKLIIDYTFNEKATVTGIWTDSDVQIDVSYKDDEKVWIKKKTFVGTKIFKGSIQKVQQLRIEFTLPVSGVHAEPLGTETLNII
uniref:Uncharacterized protein n=2 Tax=Corethron hystrix TaxID=216773 RepID=A0A7S1B7A8_9STRA|mmetsp:Transcript_15804/g.35582  ORF Transcript_15804/g.35582 Transcript_15804/m.35582 type:complete len:640 (+) Transcript_15804:203-2122(+)